MALIRGLPLFLTMCVAIPGCVGVPYTPGESVCDQTTALRLRANWPSRERDFRAVHRTILEARGRQYSFTAYALVRPAGDIRLVAIDDFGGTVFETVRRSTGEFRIVKNVGLPERWLDALTRDIEYLYLATPSAAARAVKHEGDCLALAEQLPDGQISEFCFSDAFRPIRYLRARGGRCVYSMDLPRWEDMSFPKPSIGSARIVNYALGYRLRLEVREMRESPLPDSFFSGGGDDGK